MEIKKVLGLLGCIILLIGVFTPLVGNLDSFSEGYGFGVIIILLSVNAFILTLAGKFKYTFFIGWLTLIIVGGMFFYCIYVLSKIRNQAEASLSGNPFRGFADLAMQSFHIEWGWIILFAGSVLLILTGIKKIIS
ncbi:hypothetical protein ACQUW5_02155 [Legionella sp. CNM-1927-20]|uniref:hypothetical protein n=1 Tax=Legionella sp. CNM-1927-20 TaxID=3422221 RepID=UPI00403A9AF8